MDVAVADDGMRIDTWLWAARLLKTRALAAEAVKGGRVHVNGRAVKPSRAVAPGDELEVHTGPAWKTVVVRGLAPRRVSAAQAAELYDETPASVADREARAQQRRLEREAESWSRPRPATFSRGRPTKRDRRRYESDTQRPR